MKGWRTIVIESHSRLKYQSNQFVAEIDEEQKCIPIEQIYQILVSAESGSISFPLLTALASQGTSILFCDKTHMPVSYIMPIDNQYESAGHIMDQAEWTLRRKNSVWNQIVRMKIKQ